MRRLLATTATALLFAGGASAQEAQQPQDQQQIQPGQQQAEDAQQEPQMQTAAGGFVEPGPDDLPATMLVGLPIYAPQAGADAQALQDAGDGTIDSAALADFLQVGQISDFMLDRQGEARAVIIALMPAADAPGAAVQPGAAVDPGAVGMPPAGGMQEIAVEIGQVRFLADATVPDLMFAVIGMPAEELQAAPPFDRVALGGPWVGAMGLPGDRMAGTGTAMDWRGGRAPLAAPGVVMDGFVQVPVAEVSVDNLLGASVFGADNQTIGSIGDVVFGPDGQAEYVVVDVGGFLGIGTREVAIGLDEMTILRDAGWAELRVYVDATEATLEAMPEYRADAG